MGIGIGLGGVAKGLESAEQARVEQQKIGVLTRDQALRARELGLRQDEIGKRYRLGLMTQVDKQIADELGVVSAVIEDRMKAGNSPDQIKHVIEPIMAEIDSLSADTGRDGSIYRKRVDALIAGPTAAEAATAAGQGEAAQSIAKTKALEEAGVSEGGMFAGTGFQASSANILTQLTGKADKGLPLTMADKRAYAIAYQELTSPRVVGSPTTGFSIIQPTLDPSVFPAPDSIGAPKATTPREPQIGQEVSPFGTELETPAAPRQAQGATITPLSGPKPTAEQAGRGALVAQGARGAQRVREAIVNADGSINRDTVFSMTTDIPIFPKIPFVTSGAVTLGKGVPGTEGRGVRSILEDSLASKLRLETGAQANETELQNIVDRFMPSLLDDDATIRDKMDRLNQFFGDALHKTDPELARTLIDRAAEAGNIPAPPPSEADAEFQGFDASSGVAVFKRRDGTFFGVSQKQRKAE